MRPCSGGHVEANEQLTKAVIREAREEVGIDVLPKNIVFSTCSYTHFKERPYNFFYFEVRAVKGNISIKEHNKCLDLKWFKINSLPDDIIPDVRTIIESHLKGIRFLEFGWNSL